MPLNLSCNSISSNYIVQIQAGLKSRIPIMHNKNPPMLVALRKPTVSEVTSLKDSTSENTSLFSIRRVERVNTSLKGICVDRRLYNDVFEVRKLQFMIFFLSLVDYQSLRCLDYEVAANSEVRDMKAFFLILHLKDFR